MMSKLYFSIMRVGSREEKTALISPLPSMNLASKAPNNLPTSSIHKVYENMHSQYNSDRHQMKQLTINDHQNLRQSHKFL